MITSLESTLLVIVILLAFGIAALIPIAVKGWLGGASSEFGRQAAAKFQEQNEERRKAKQVAAKADEARRAKEEAALAAAEKRRKLEEERVGSRFRWRASADDVGMIGTVEELDQRSPATRVIIRWHNPEGRTPTPYDRPPGRVSTEWRHLTLPVADQRHRTARLILRSYNDADGWIEFEKLDDSDD